MSTYWSDYNVTSYSTDLSTSSYKKDTGTGSVIARKNRRWKNPVDVGVMKCQALNEDNKKENIKEIEKSIETETETDTDIKHKEEKSIWSAIYNFFTCNLCKQKKKEVSGRKEGSGEGGEDGDCKDCEDKGENKGENKEKLIEDVQKDLDKNTVNRIRKFLGDHYKDNIEEKEQGKGERKINIELYLRYKCNIKLLSNEKDIDGFNRAVNSCLYDGVGKEFSYTINLTGKEKLRIDGDRFIYSHKLAKKFDDGIEYDIIKDFYLGTSSIMHVSIKGYRRKMKKRKSIRR